MMSGPLSTDQIAVELPDETVVDWREMFGNNHPVEVEIGTGKATFLIRRAQANPARNFLGIEWANSYFTIATDRIRRRRMHNVRMTRLDAAHFLRVLCPAESLDVLHVYHPDPWPKKRHHKRRLIQPVNIEAAVRCLKAGARWAVQTDHSEYFEVIETLLSSHTLLEVVPFDDSTFGVEDSRIATNYEIKYLREGREIFQIAVRKRPEA